MGCAQSEIAPQNETPRKGCTDVLWLIIYIIFWILMIVVAAISFVYGNPQRLINGVDSFGNTCGVKSNQKLINFPLAGISTIDKKFLFFMDLKELRRSMKICVKECPDRKMKNFTDIQNFYRDTGSNLCRYDINPNNVTSTKDLHNYIGPCPTMPLFDSFPLFNRCFPKSAMDVAERVAKDFHDLVNSWDTIEQMLSDLYSSWKEMIICVIIAFICSLLMVSILHLLATLVSWIFMIIVSIASVAGTALLWYTYYELKHKQMSFTEQAAYLDESLKNESAFLWYSIIATIITVILLIIVLVMRSRVSFLAALFKETAHCLGSIPALFLQPIITFFFLILFFTFWSIVVVCLATANYPGIPYKTNFFINGSTLPDHVDTAAVEAQNINKSANLKNFTLDNIEFDPLWVKSMWWLCLICLVWGSEFILGCQQMTIAGAVSHWYFRGPHAHSPVLYSIGKLLKYHLGSVAKGSFLITLFKIPRLILTYLHAKLSARAEKGSECAKCGLKCGICCFYCLEKFIRYLNHNAYTVITIERCHFCKAAARAFSTIVNNALQVATINSVGDFILFLGKCIVTAVTGIVGLLLLKRNSDLHFFAVPTLVICIFSFFIAHCILSLYEVVTGIVGLLLLKRNSDLHFFAVPTLVICVFSFFIAHCILSLYESNSLFFAVPTLVICMFSFFIAHCILSLDEMVVDSLFICVCEDRNMNGGDGRWKSSRLAELGGHAATEQNNSAELQDLQEKY